MLCAAGVALMAAMFGLTSALLGWRRQRGTVVPLLIAVLALLWGGAGKADPIWNIGGTVTVNGTSAPNTFTQLAPLTLGTIAIDGGTLNLTTSIVNEAGGAEWLILQFATANGGPIGPTSGSWQLQALEPLVAPANSLGFFLDWSSNGTLLTPTNSFDSASPGTNPVTGSGTVLVNNTFCPYNTWRYIVRANNTVSFFAFTTDYASAPGNNGSSFLNANDFEIGIEMTPVATPVPAALPLFASGLGALGLLGWRRKRKGARTMLPLAAA